MSLNHLLVSCFCGCAAPDSLAQYAGFTWSEQHGHAGNRCTPPTPNEMTVSPLRDHPHPILP